MGDFMLGRLTEMRQSMPSTLSPSQHYVGALRAGHVAHDDRADAELRRAVGAVLPDGVAGESVRRHPRLQLQTSTRSRRASKSAVFPNAPAGFTYPSQNAGRVRPGGLRRARRRSQKRLNKFAPRVGVGWDPTGIGRTPIRASYGIAYDVVALKALLNSNNVSPWAADIIHRTGTLDNPWLGHAGRQPVPVRLADDADVPARLGVHAVRPGPRHAATCSRGTRRSSSSSPAAGWCRRATSAAKSERLWNTTAINPALILTPQSHPQLFTGPDTCVLEGVTFTPCNPTTNINQRRELRLWAAQNNPALLADARAVLEHRRVPLRQHGRTTTAC